MALLFSPCRGFPIYEFNNPKISPLILSTDFSSYGFSAILSQIQYGREILLACVARKTTVEQSYSSFKGELRAIINFFVTDAMSPAGLKILKPCLSESGRNSVQGFIHQPTIPFFKQSIEEYIQQSILQSQHYEYITNS